MPNIGKNARANNIGVLNLIDPPQRDIKNADNIVVIDKGKIVESGKHEKLLDQNKIYADLWNVQVGI